MKKISAVLAILLIAATMFALTACSSSGGYEIKNATDDEEAESIKAKDYDKDFDGLIDYLLDKGYIFNYMYSKSDSSEKISLKSDLYYEVIGAKNGVRYYFTDQKTYIEIYDFSGKSNSAAEKALKDIKDDGKFKPTDTSDNLTAVISDSGKYVIAYNESNKYDYDKITDELENW